MKSILCHSSRAVLLGLFLTVGANAHPGSPGHYHPDEVDEFEQVAHTAPAVENARELNIGAIVVLAGIVASLGFALFQKQGGIWKDVTVNH